MSGPPALVVREGTCHAVLAFDVGREIDVRRASDALGAEPAPPAGTGRPPYLQFARPPVRCTVPVEPVAIGEQRTEGEAVVVLFEFGAAAVVFGVPVQGTLGRLAEVGAALCVSDALASAARRLLADVVARLGTAVDAPHIADVVEEYLVFHLRRVETDVPTALWPVAFGAELAAVLRAETLPLSAQEIERTIAAPVSFSPGDLVMVDWNAALAVRERVDDLLAVLTFANVQLLEMRFLDARLDDDLQRSYGEVLGPGPRFARFRTTHRGALEQIARRQIDAALLFEHVRNAPKLLGDQYLARVYESAARRFRLTDWNDAIHSKLDVLGTIYERVRDRSAVARAEVLEWIIILLILFEVVWPFVRPSGR